MWTDSAFLINVRREFSPFLPQLKISSSITQKATSRFKIRLRLTGRYQGCWTQETGIISIRTEAKKFFISSTCSRRQCTFVDELWILIVCFWMLNTPFNGHTIRGSFRIQMWLKDLRKLSFADSVFDKDCPASGSGRLRRVPYESSWPKTHFLEDAFDQQVMSTRRNTLCLLYWNGFDYQCLFVSFQALQVFQMLSGQFLP